MLRFKVEVLAVTANQEKQILDMLPRSIPRQRHTFDAQSDAMKAALRHVSRQPGIRTVETMMLETRSGVHVVERKETGRIRVLAQCVPEISPQGIISVDFECQVSDDEFKEEPMTKLYQGQSLFAGDSSQVLVTRYADQAESAARWRNRYVVRITYSPVK